MIQRLLPRGRGRSIQNILYSIFLYCILYFFVPWLNLNPPFAYVSILTNQYRKVLVPARRGVGLVGRGQGGCERRIKVFVKIQKKNWGGSGGGRGLGRGGGGWLGGQGGCERRIKLFCEN